MGGDEYESKVFIDGEFQFSSTMKYSGIAQNSYGQEGDQDYMKYTIESTQGQVTYLFCKGLQFIILIQSRMPGMSFCYQVKAEDGSLIKQETVSFHGPNRMIVEEAANDVAMITVYEKQ